MGIFRRRVRSRLRPPPSSLTVAEAGFRADLFFRLIKGLWGPCGPMSGTEKALEETIREFGEEFSAGPFQWPDRGDECAEVACLRGRIAYAA